MSLWFVRNDFDQAAEFLDQEEVKWNAHIVDGYFVLV